MDHAILDAVDDGLERHVQVDDHVHGGFRLKKNCEKNILRKCNAHIS